MLREVAVAALGLAGAALTEAAKLQKRDGAHGHDHGASSHAHDSGGYGAPAASYGAPAPSYEEPAASYAAPSEGYGAPATGYGGYEEEGLPDLTPIIVGILVLTGLSLLFPTYVSLTSVRRKRHAEDDVNPLADVVERVNDVYNAVVQSEECMERIACEIGGIAHDVGLKESPITKMADPFVPSKYKTYYKQFQSGSNCHKIKCGSLAF